MVSQLSTLNSQLLQQHFDTLAETPDAVAKLRNFVLSLAVRGQLLPQNVEDEKPARWKEFAAKFSQPNAQDQEPPFLLPKSWRWVRLDDVADYAAADKVDPSEIKDGDWVLDLEEIEKDTSRIIRIARFAEKQSSSTKAKFLPGDVLYGKLRPYLNKVVVAPQAGFCTTEIVPIRSRGLIEPTYLCVFLRSPDFVSYANSKSYGMKMPRLGTDDATSAWVAVPPPAEQRRIVAKVEELLALCDELAARQTDAREHRTRLVRSALNHLTTAKDESEFKEHSAFCIQHSELLFDSVSALRQAVLSLAVQGKLVRQNAKDESASQIVHRIRAEKAKGIVPNNEASTKRFHNSPAVEAPFGIPVGWEWSVLDDLSLFTNGKAHEQIVDLNGKYVLVNSRFVSTGGSRKKFASEILTPLLIGDLAIVMSDVPDGRALGRCFMVDKDNYYTLNQRICSVRMLGQIEPKFAYLILDRNQHFLSFNDGKKQTNLKKSQILSCPFPLPPLAEQQRIVAKVDELLRWCDALAARLTAAQTAAASLLDATLHQILTA
jgi:type I restriction enzyme S subunit